MIQLINGDCVAYMQSMPSESIDCVVTDPPYIINGGKRFKSEIFMSEIENVKRGKMFSHNDIQFSEWVPEVYRVLKPQTHCYIMTSGRHLMELQEVCEKAGFTYQNLLIWDKGTVTPNKFYMNRCEFILMLRKGKSRWIHDMGSSTLISIKNVTGNKTHPTEKPVSLMAHLIANSTDAGGGGVILDPFMGSGTTGVACKELNRNFTGIEIDKKYFEIAERRIKSGE